MRSSGSEESTNGEPSERPVSLTSVRDTATTLDVEGPITAPTIGRVVGVLSSPDTMRGILAVGFAAIFGLTIVAAFWLSSTPSWPNAKELLQLLLPAETAILGSTVGFYFGSKR